MSESTVALRSVGLPGLIWGLQELFPDNVARAADVTPHQRPRFFPQVVLLPVLHVLPTIPPPPRST